MTRRPPAAIAREAIASSAEFRAFVETQSLEAQRRRDDRLAEIEAKQTTISRSFSDHESFRVTTEDEIEDLRALIDDDNEIIAGAERALTMSRPAPKLTTRETPVTDEIGRQ